MQNFLLVLIYWFFDLYAYFLWIRDTSTFIPILRYYQMDTTAELRPLDRMHSIDTHEIGPIKISYHKKSSK